MELMTSIPRQEQIRGIQSINVRWVVEPLRGDLEKVALSMKRKKPRENWWIC